MSLLKDINTFNMSALQHVETVVRQNPVDLEALQRLNPALAAFYVEHLMPVPEPISLPLIISTTSNPVSSNYFDWEILVRPVNESHYSLIQSVIFDLHPTFNPPSIQIINPPFLISRKGWGEFKIAITINDINGSTHHLSHHLNLHQPSEKHETISIKPQNKSKPSNSKAPPKMADTPESEMHGVLGVGRGWEAPTLVTFCNEEARPGYSSVKAHEYNENPLTLREKVKVLAELIRKSNHFLAYTGAGISTASGIDDYASKSKDSVATGVNSNRAPKKRGHEVEPTYAHYVMSALYRKGYLKHWVQQNHDGLPQKAGFPQHAINEIHGAWYDPSNPVVPMSGTLRSDLFAWMRREEKKSDLVIAMGTSLCGMNADRMVVTPSEKFIKQSKGLGSVIIGFQKTKLDYLSSLRIFAKIDEVMLLLAIEMQLDVQTTPYILTQPHTQKPHHYLVPYDENGQKNTQRQTMWNLSIGAKVMLTEGPGKGFKGVVIGTPKNGVGDYCVDLPNTREGPSLGKGRGRYSLGSWWVESCVKGDVPLLPFININ
jgi:NAD-dependent SIR2 family protein deacetylase